MSSTNHVDDSAKSGRCALQAAVWVSLAVAQILFVPPSGAQQQQSVEPTVEEITVTGSRIRTANLTSLAPITVIDSGQLEVTKTTNLEDIVRKLPDLDSNNGAVSSNLNNNGGNAATTALRNLGPTRTLILIDGLRVPYTDYGGPIAAVELSSIPVGMIERIEILKGGASSIYGADAIGGVINLITKKDFEGTRITATGGVSGLGDSDTYQITGQFGADYDRGNIVVNVGYITREPLIANKRDWATSMHFGTPQAGQGPRSSGIPGLIGFMSEVGDVYFYGPSGQFEVVRPIGGEPRDILAEQGITPPPGVFFLPGQAQGYFFNFLATGGTLGAGIEQRNVSLRSTYEISPTVDLILDASYWNKNVEMILTALPFSSGGSTPAFPGFYIPANLEDFVYDPLTGRHTRSVVGGPNPGNPFGVDIVGSTRLLERPRTQLNDVNTYRVRVGIDGEIPELFEWSVGYVNGRTRSISRQTNSINLRRLSQVTGQRPCGADAALGCSIGNFLGVNTLTENQLNYIFSTPTTPAGFTQDYIYGTVTGDLFDLPAGAMSAAGGVEYRRERGFRDPTETGESPFPTAPTSGSYEVTSAFGELYVPLLTDAGFAKSLAINTSFRYDNYSNFDGAFTWSAGVDLVATSAVRLRAVRSTAFRAPQIAELFGGKFRLDATGTDPCTTDIGRFARSPRCLQDLAAVGQDGNTFVTVRAGQVPSTTGGNPDLQPEEAVTWGVGAVLTPPSLPQLSATVDYYDIDLENAVGQFSAQSILDSCYGPEGQRCDQIFRGATGDIVSVETFRVNAGAERTRGVDATLNYVLDFTRSGPLAGASLSLGLAANYLISHEVESPTGAVREQAGTFQFGTSSVSPKWKGRLDTSLAKGRLSLDWGIRYIGSVRNVNGTPRGPGNFADDVLYHDLSGSFQLLESTRIIIGVDNLFDRTPPYLADGGTNSISTGIYDYTGRFIYGRAILEF